VIELIENNASDRTLCDRFFGIADVPFLLNDWKKLVDPLRLSKAMRIDTPRAIYSPLPIKMNGAQKKGWENGAP
jgi:hypothetical protein